MTYKEKIKEEIERRFNDNMKASEQYTENSKSHALFTSAAKEDYDLLAFIDSLPEEPKFKVGDMVISTNNPSLTYKVLQVGLLNELGELDYRVEIFDNGKPGIKVGNEFKEHNIHLISCKKMDEWGKLIPEEHNEDLKEEFNRFLDEEEGVPRMWHSDEQMEWGMDIARHFAEWQKQQQMKDAVETNIVNDWQYGKDPDHAIIPAIHQRISGFNVGDKVKIIIIKEEQQ